MGKKTAPLRRAIRKITPVRASVFAEYRKETRRRLEHIEQSLKETERSLDSANTAISEKSAIDEQVACDQNRALANISREVCLISQLQEKMDESAAQSNRIVSRLGKTEDERKMLYVARAERAFIEPFREPLFSHDLAERYLALTRGMDQKSKDTVARIIARQQRVLEEDGEIDIYSAEEQEALRSLRWEMKNGVTKLSDSLYCFKGYFLPVNHFEPSVFVYRHGIDDLAYPERIAKKDIIDVGGYIGDSAIVLSPLTTGKVVTFEASSENFELLKTTIALNESKNVMPVKMALGESAGSLEINYCGSSTSAYASEAHPVQYKETCPMNTLDAYCAENPLDIGLIKVDIEGYEQPFLRGARKTIEAQRPTLLISIYHNPSDFFDIKPMLESWDLGYSFKIHKPLDNMASCETLLIAEVE